MIFVTLSTFAEFDRHPLQLLEQSRVPFRVHSTGRRITTEELLADGADAEVLIAGVEPYDRRLLERLPKLRCISRCGVGVDAIDLDVARERGIVVVNTPDPPTDAVAELALTMMLSLGRNLPRQFEESRAHRWTRLEAHLLGARRVGIIGLGRIGRRVAELAGAFGATVVATDPHADAAWCARAGVSLVSLDTLLSTADVVSIHAAKSKDRPLRLGTAELSRMRRGSLLISLGRGDMVDEAALHEALTSGQLAGAGLDVYSKEPYDGPLCDLSNVVLTPHSATLTVETRSAMETQCVEQALAFLAGITSRLNRVV